MTPLVRITLDYPGLILLDCRQRPGVTHWGLVTSLEVCLGRVGICLIVYGLGLRPISLPVGTFVPGRGTGIAWSLCNAELEVAPGCAVIVLGTAGLFHFRLSKPEVAHALLP